MAAALAMLVVGGAGMECSRDQDALVAAEAALVADVKEALDLLVYCADGLYLAVLVYRPGYRQPLPDSDAPTMPSTSLQPSSIIEARASRSSFSTGYSRLRPLPP